MDFISKLTPLLEVEVDEHTLSTWTLFVNGSTTSERDGAGLILKYLNKQVYERALQFEFKISNNMVEYEAFLSGL